MKAKLGSPAVQGKSAVRGALRREGGEEEAVEFRAGKAGMEWWLPGDPPLAAICFLLTLLSTKTIFKKWKLEELVELVVE